MRKSPIHAVLLVAVLASSPFAFAASPQQAAPSGAAAGQQASRPAQRQDLFDQLGLTDAQRSTIRQLIQQNVQQARPQIEALRQKRLAFDDATPGSSQFQTTASDLAQAESSAARDQVQRQADLRTKVYNVLTSAQRTKLATLISQRRQQMQQRSEGTAPASH